MGEKKAVLLVLLDLSAAFDTVDTNFLLAILRQHGICGTVFKWFQSYLTNRSQQINISNSRSNRQELTCGVPQGSDLGPSLFTIYTASLGRLLRRLNVPYHLYADDTQLYLSFKPNVPSDASDTVFEMEQCINAVREWMVTHKLKMNDSKTEVLLISSSRLNFSSLSSITVGECVTPISANARNIGLMMDSSMTMDKHIKYVCKKSYWQIHNLGKLRPYLSKEALVQLVHAFISSHIDYCNSLFIGLPDSQLQKLQKNSEYCSSHYQWSQS
eukprot:GHVU01135588.1.p1 GENE.GHVU01135588.1~~GHVU01135588.1.p1  ORF type:complete len:271 (+),score=18.60 GHVU01135588.1:396-1208(+)